jgi:hypothetical protein
LFSINNVADATTKTFLPIEEMVVSLIENDIEGAFGDGSIVVKRSKLTALMEVE